MLVLPPKVQKSLVEYDLLSMVVFQSGLYSMIICNQSLLNRAVFKDCLI
jgi:hypothetical protein